MDKQRAESIVRQRAERDVQQILSKLQSPFTMQDIMYILFHTQGRYASECVAVVQRLVRFGVIKEYTGDNYSDKRRRWERV